MTASRPKLSWSDLAGARVGVWGLGREGRANLRKLLSLGAEPVLVDDAPAGPVAVPGGVLPVLVTRETGLAALERCDVVVKTPGLSRYRPEVARLSGLGIPVVGGLGLWLAEADLRRVLCVTGTKGKSTTSSVTGYLLTRLGYRCMVAGNIGVSPYDPAEAGDFDYWVVEVSSYQATDLPYSPPVVAVTSLHPDHLDWHGGVEQYYRDKLSACSQPGADLTVANGDSDLLRERAALLGPRVEWVCVADDPDADWMEPLGLLGRHNRRNALIARRCLAALGVPGSGDDARLIHANESSRPIAGGNHRPIQKIGTNYLNVAPPIVKCPIFAHPYAYAGARVNCRRASKVAKTSSRLTSCQLEIRWWIIASLKPSKASRRSAGRAGRFSNGRTGAGSSLAQDSAPSNGTPSSGAPPPSALEKSVSSAVSRESFIKAGPPAGSRSAGTPAASSSTSTAVASTLSSTSAPSVRDRSPCIWEIDHRF